MEQIHATTVDIDGSGVLLSGPSGSGKSDLALRLIDGGARLVADDRTDLALADGRLVASVPREIAGRMEVRGLGVLEKDAVPQTVLALVVELVGPEDVERAPETATVTFLGVDVPVVRLHAFEASAAAKVRAVLMATGAL
ncbi:MAG: HPr kinase/phosphatase C-terminal domain-containing protein [Proteobacteria bacterium]|nr:HPr kinase/phosphatase C-terminal domain-containing protein [Pseudomonadota bacterium]